MTPSEPSTPLEKSVAWCEQHARDLENSAKVNQGEFADDLIRWAKHVRTLLTALEASPSPGVPDGWRKIDWSDDPPPRGEWIWLYEGGAQYKGGWDTTGEYWQSDCGQPVVYNPEPTHWMPLPTPPEGT